MIGVVFGLALVFLPRLFDDPMSRVMYDTLNGAGAYDALDAAARDYHDWVYGVTGATVAGWCIVVTAVGLIPFRRGERWAWIALALAVGVWFAVDSLTSLLHGVTPNLLVNLAFLLGFGLPLAGSRRAFFAPR